MAESIWAIINWTTYFSYTKSSIKSNVQLTNPQRFLAWQYGVEEQDWLSQAIEHLLDDEW